MSDPLNMCMRILKMVISDGSHTYVSCSYITTRYINTLTDLCVYCPSFHPSRTIFVSLPPSHLYQELRVKSASPPEAITVQGTIRPVNWCSCVLSKQRVICRAGNLCDRVIGTLLLYYVCLIRKDIITTMAAHAIPHCSRKIRSIIYSK